MLASGADDKSILLYELSPGGGGKVFGSDDVIIENWKNVGMLRGHVAGIEGRFSKGHCLYFALLDLSDLSWSPDGTKIASACLDNVVMVWDVGRRGTSCLDRNRN